MNASKTSKGTVVLIDGNSLLYRAFFAMPHFSTLENQPTNAVYGFTMMLLRVLDELKPEVFLVTFDAHAKTFRHDEFAEYKAHRKPMPDDLVSQGPLVREMVRAFNIPIYEIEGFEADDVVGTLARKAEADGYSVTIVTGDLDELQLVDDAISVMTTIKGVTETVVYDRDAVIARYGLNPEQLPDYKSLRGDASDNIPGVPGIGDKIAQRLIGEHGSLENLLANLDDVQEKRIRSTLTESVDIALLSKRLATIVTDVPLDVDFDACRFMKPDNSVLREIFKRLEFKTLLKRFSDAEPPTQMNLFPVGAARRELVSFVVVNTPDALASMLDSIGTSKAISLKITGTTSRGIDSDAVGIGISLESEGSFYIPVSLDLGLSDLRAIMESNNIRKIGCNLKYEAEILQRNGIPLNGPLFDVMIAAYLLNPSRSAPTIEDIAFDYANMDLGDYSGKKDGRLDDIARASISQADAAMKLAPILKDKLDADNLNSLFTDIEIPLVPILADMELTGISVDTGWLTRLSVSLGEGIVLLESEIYELAGTDFNIGSPKQLQVILFEKLGLPSAKKTKTGYSTDADTLNALAPAHEIVAKILEYRELTKLKSTYADSLPKLINAATGRIHTSLNQAVASTGRLSSSEPNLQNIPIKTEIGREIRKAFIASKGNLLVSADYSQIELRILAHISHDPQLVDAFRTDQDIHTRTASSLFGVPEESVTTDMRRQAKTVNFAVIYGMSDYGLSRALGIPVGIAKMYIESYFRQYPGVKWYAAETLEHARKKGYVESLLGRRRYVPELNSQNRQAREFAERAAVNMPIQGTAADIVKIAMVRVFALLRESGLATRLVLQIHDELVFDAPRAEVPRIVPIIRNAMESAYSLDAPLRVEIKSGADWCTAQPVSAEEYAEGDIAV